MGKRKDESKDDKELDDWEDEDVGNEAPAGDTSDKPKEPVKEPAKEDKPTPTLPPEKPEPPKPGKKSTVPVTKVPGKMRKLL